MTTPREQQRPQLGTAQDGFTLQIALLRAKCIARREAGRAQRLLVEAGVPFREAGKIVLAARRGG